METWSDPSNHGAALAAALFFMHLHLHSVDGDDAPAKYQALYLWISILWLMLLTGVCITTQRNILAETISFAFMVLSIDVKKPRLLISIPAEHHFGTTHVKKHEWCRIPEYVRTGQRRDNAMYEGNLVPLQEALKGCGAMCK